MKKIILLFVICAIGAQAQSQSWNLTGNAGTNTATNFIGTTDAKALYLKTSNKTRLAITSGGKVGIGLTVPDARLQVASTSLSSISSGGAFQIGLSNTYNVVMDNNELQARSNGIGSTLYLQYWGGDINACASGGTANFNGPVSMSTDLSVLNNIGIGTLTPNYNLDINSIDYSAENIYSPYNGGTVSNIIAAGTTAGTWGLYAYATTLGYAGYFSGNIYCTGSYLPSDEKLKENILPLENALDKVMKLEVKTYNFKSGLDEMNLPHEKQYGFLAQNLESVFPELVKFNPSKKEQPLEFKAVNYLGMIPVLTEAMQEQQKQIEAKDKAIGDLQKQLDEMKQCIQSICNNASQKNSSSNVSEESPKLFQNHPNPFNQTTVIRFNLSAKSTNSLIVIRDLNGNQVKSIAVSNTGIGQVTINANEFSPGTYTYSLEVAGESVDSKLMVITR